MIRLNSRLPLLVSATLSLAIWNAAQAADTITLVTSSSALNANDSVFWNTLGSDSATVPNSFSVTSSGGKTIQGSFAGTIGIVAKVGSSGSWGPASGATASNDVLIWAFDSAATRGTGAITIVFPSAGFGAGAAVQADAPGQFTAKIELFNGSTSLGSVTRTSAGDAIFIGALDSTGPNATRAVFSLTACQNNTTAASADLGDFALDTVSLNIATKAPPTITNGPPPNGTVGVAYNFAYTSTGSPTFSVSSGALPNGLSLSSSGVISGTPTTAGTFNGVVTATNGVSPDATQAFNIAIVTGGGGGIAGPTFTSPATATPNPAFIGQSVTFNAAASGSIPLTFKWDFGDGTTGTSTHATHIYSTAGVHAATVTATDINNAKSSSSVVVTVNAPEIGTGPDANGDGIADSLNQLLGINPADPSTFALSDPTAPATPLKISKMQVKLNFAKKSSDGVAISGTLPIPAGAKLNGQKLIFQIGEFAGVLTLNAKGQSKSTGAQFAVQVKAKKGTIGAQTAKFSLKVGPADLASALSSSGLVNDTTHAKVNVPVTLIFNKILYQKTQALSYSAKADKSGIAK